MISSPEIYRAVIQYLKRFPAVCCFRFRFLVIRSFLVGITCTRALSWAAKLPSSDSIPLNYILIIVGGLGISGATIASSLAEIGSLVILLFYVWLKIDKGKYGLKPVYDELVEVDVLSLSVWSMLHAFISVAPWFLFFVAEGGTFG